MNLHQLKQLLLNNLWHGENGGERPQSEYPVLYSLVTPDASRVWGVDISHWNLPPVDLPRMVSQFGMSFVIIKGCDGSLNTRYYDEHVAQAKVAGIPWGMYVWLYPNSKVSISAQVAAWSARAKADPPPLGVFIDAEWTYYGGLPANPSASDLRAAHDKFKSAYGESATTYTAPGYASGYLQGFDFTKEPLWIAHYGVSKPTLPGNAETHEFWQFTSTLDGHVLDPNGNAELDGNYFNGTAEQFAAKYGGGGTPPPTGGEMYKLKVNAPAGLNGRGTPGGVVKDKYKYGDILTADASQLYNGTVWHQITAWERDGQPLTMAKIPEYASEGLPTDSAYPYLVPVAIEPPPVEPPPPVTETEIIITVKDDKVQTITENGVQVYP